MRGINGKQLAERMGITNSALTISLKKGNPSLNTLERIATALDVPLPVLMSEDVKKSLAPAPSTKEVPFLRCPNCGGKIHLYARGEGEE